MKIDVLLFTQTMHSLLSSFLSLQSSLSICSEIFNGKKERQFVSDVLKKVSEGKKFSESLKKYKNTFPPLYISLVEIGEESTTLSQVFSHLCLYLKSKKNMSKKIMQSLLYPVLVLLTATALVCVLTIFVMPRLEWLFEAFETSSSNIKMQIEKIKFRFILSSVITAFIILLIVISATLRKADEKARLVIDSIILKIPVIKKLAVTMQMNDFSFAMKLLCKTHFPLVQSLCFANEVLSNFRIKKSVTSACKNIIDGESVATAFENEKIFPKYLTVWLKIAEENGNVSEAFTQISDYYQSENDTILNTITQSAEPVFTLITGAIIISIIVQFVIPLFNLLGAL